MHRYVNGGRAGRMGEMAADAPTVKEAPPTYDQGLVGKVLNGRYRLIRMLGRGGMGAVYDAEQVGSGLPFAVKVVKLDGRGNPETLRMRVAREAQVGEHIEHPGIVRVHELCAWDEEPALFIVMDLLDGETLYDRITASRVGLPWRQAVEVAREVARALTATHAYGVIHRDLKPHNIFLTRDGRVIVLDFGIAFIAQEILTNTGLVLGSPGFMAPEQLEAGHKIDARTDVWGLGAVLFAALTGEAPIRAALPVEALAEIKQAPIVSVAKWNPTVPPLVVELVADALAVDPDARFPDMQAFIEACDDALAADPIIG